MSDTSTLTPVDAEKTLLTADIQVIQSILPHRYPFLLVDRVIDIDGTTSAVGIKNVSMNEPHFQGHFPGNPIMPGVTIVEAMAQTATVMVGAALGKTDNSIMVYFMGIDECKFRRKVVPGDQLRMKVTTLRGKPGGKVWRFRGEATVDGELACECEFTAMTEAKA
ncbi:3-hydroxyacyl-ACP dehydratase FabZ [Ketogulonicigenium vulgare]|nr:3-hydroxyacyl-ACP dehydratase FabZ [Ketogulonicigenium vulgare]ADO42688.1 beta-hydroxyacyl-(acyl-carrier-protein) dehydratase FabZ [Ketogulonicigenium vulgare Y25]ALJ81039.1 3-hydroxyacyl-ACP dehydratase [Ketogulonicigenium vulgare]ANW33794.1 3-hydroxyacyl-[acyl-carrier-protein] dehydratase FabZ [Ketogulonicigenium vulgare]AOZ54598.1 Beta-hydroxyacyl-(Acyl-carrier-protein) dehydratase FabZ [Ketogulonicigenium vulgare]